EGEILAVGDAACDEDGERVEQREHDGHRHRRRQTPADADARDHEDVQQKERAGAALREERDHRHPDDVRDRREVPDALLAYVLAAHHEEQHEAEKQVRSEHRMAELRVERGLLRIDHHDRPRAHRQQHAAERDDLLGPGESLEWRRPAALRNAWEGESLHRKRRLDFAQSCGQQLTCHGARRPASSPATPVPRRAARSGGTASHLIRWGGDLQVAMRALTSGHAAPTLPGMDTPAAGSEPVVTLTPYAVEMVRKVRAREGLSDSATLRVAAVGGAWSGFSY